MRMGSPQRAIIKVRAGIIAKIMTTPAARRYTTRRTDMYHELLTLQNNRAMKTKLKTLVKVATQRSKRNQFPIVFRGDTATAMGDDIELTLRIPIVWSGDEPNDGVQIDAANVRKIADCLGDAECLRIELSGDYATINGVRVMIDGSPAGGITPNDEPRSELQVTEELREAVENVRECAGSDQLRPIFRGIYIGSDIVAATDAHVMAWRDVATGLPDGVSAVVLPEVFDLLPDGCRTIWVGSEYNVAESDAGRVVSKRPDSGRPYPNVRAVIPSKNDGTVVLSGAAVRDALKTAKKRKLRAVALVVRDGAAGFEFLECYDDDNGDNMRVSLPCRVIDGSPNRIMVMGVALLTRLLSGAGRGDFTVKYREGCEGAILFDGVGVLMPIMDRAHRGEDFHPEAIPVRDAEPTSPTNPETFERQRIVELPDGTYVVIGGRKPKGGRAVKAWIVDSIEI